ncbi:ABC-2 type transport system permease protein [Cryobacterium mesophilum]|uniref:Transport permease protein n=1 Tax=Terrimesophilobacter mesophilus TaxID=433647 RepID=A0A4R8VE78_9MICO|nr:ABC transporter permease [Terrimesophilobacter mesophilus]MBB5633428.1 ABC-2 type transport system permease protein [Terrimesophilobacter mesophilus]TFB80147.1 ABC transporter permease [Terrimesophilobacter mesophilus]
MTTTTTAQPPTTEPAPRIHSLGRSIRLGLSRVGYELKVYARQGDSVFFTFLFPILMLSIFAVAFSNAGNIGAAPDGTGGITWAAFYLPGMVAAGMLLSGVQNLGVDIAGEKGDGTLKRLGGSPLPVISYFIGKIGMVLVSAVLQAALLLVVARFAFGVDLPTGPEKWLLFVWVFLLGVVTSCVLGIALSALPRSGKSATAVVIPIVLLLQFISGVYLQFSMLPEWLQNVASIFPLKWMAQGMRAVFLPESFAALEQTGDWNLPWVAIIMGVWFVVGLFLCRMTFRWIRKDS